MYFTPAGISSRSIRVRENADESILSTPSEMTSLCIPAELKACSPISRTDEGSTSSVREVYRNAQSPIVRREGDRTICFNGVFSNACSAIDRTVSGSTNSSGGTTAKSTFFLSLSYTMSSRTDRYSFPSATSKSLKLMQVSKCSRDSPCNDVGNLIFLIPVHASNA